MAMLPGPQDLNNHHRDTLTRIFQHPTSHNIEWPDVISLFEAVGTVVEHKHGRVEIRVGREVRYFERPRHKDIDVQQVVDLRHLLRDAGYGPGTDPRGDQVHEG